MPGRAAFVICAVPLGSATSSLAAIATSRGELSTPHSYKNLPPRSALQFGAAIPTLARIDQAHETALR